MKETIYEPHADLVWISSSNLNQSVSNVLVQYAKFFAIHSILNCRLKFKKEFLWIIKTFFKIIV
jgi:hypothetical protein